MNITDIDDKIIIKARQNFLVAEYKRKTHTLSAETKQLLIKSLNDEIGFEKQNTFDSFFLQKSSYSHIHNM